jgi:hypothetical protein
LKNASIRAVALQSLIWLFSKLPLACTAMYPVPSVDNAYYPQARAGQLIGLICIVNVWPCPTLLL